MGCGVGGGAIDGRIEGFIRCLGRVFALVVWKDVWAIDTLARTGRVAEG